MNMELEGSDVVDYLSGYGSVRDGSLVSLSIQQISKAPIIKLVFKVPQIEGGIRVVTLELREVQEFDYGFSKENPPDIIEFVKCIMTDTGEFFLSLDPYDERESFISEKDNEFFRSKFVKLTTP
jgi:hypothetical protein